MRILTGDECGLLKEIIPELSRPKQQQESNKIQSSTQDGVRRIDPNEEQRRSRGVIDMAFTSLFKDSFAVLRANGTVQLWEGTYADKESFGKYQCTGVVQNVFESANSSDSDTSTDGTTQQQHYGRPIALDSLTEQKRLCAADSLGNIAVLDTNATCTPSVVALYSPFAKQAQTLSYTKGSHANNNICTAMAVDSRGGRVAIGGRERETCLLDIESGNIVWKAKNLAPDPQTLLQHPIWSTALLFLNDSASLAGSNHVMATGTAFKQVRLYDVRTNSTTRRPIAYTPEGLLSHRVTALCQVDSNQLVVGDAAGFLYALDMRILGKKHKGNLNLKRFVGPAGSVRQVMKHESLPIIATAGLDRMLRTYNVKTQRQLDCIYLKQRLNCLLFCNDDTWALEEDTTNKNIVEEGDLDVEDDVQDYVYSSGEDDDSSEDGSELEKENGEENNSESDDSGLSSEDDNEEPKEEFEDESDEDSQTRHASKKRRV